MFYDLARLKFFWMAEKSLWRSGVYTPGAPQNEAAKELALGYIDAVFADRPDLKKAMTPTYPMWGKRLVLDSRFYPALKRENVELVPRAVHSVTRTGLVDADGVERDTDVVIFATGFEPTNYLGTMEIVGVGGQTLREYWNAEPRAYFGITVPGFPNMFIIYGPGTNGGEIVSNLLAQGRYATRAVKQMCRQGMTAVEVKRLWADLYDVWLQSRMASTSWVETNNYFTASSGKVVTQWPYSATVYRVLLRALGRPSVTMRRTSDFERRTS
jgi:cation diffusion facilitator CzcD-associated flavoprotein CzcO